MINNALFYGNQFTIGVQACFVNLLFYVNWCIMHIISKMLSWNPRINIITSKGGYYYETFWHLSWFDHRKYQFCNWLYALSRYLQSQSLDVNSFCRTYHLPRHYLNWWRRGRGRRWGGHQHPLNVSSTVLKWQLSPGTVHFCNL